MNIFSLSFQGLHPNGDPNSHNRVIIPHPLVRDKMNHLRYGTCDKIVQKHNKLMDTSFLLNRLAHKGKGPMRPRNYKQAYADLERINRSERIRQDLMERYASKHRKREERSKYFGE